MPEKNLRPDTDEIRRDLEYMVARWGELSEPAVFEIRAFAEGKQPQSMKFAPDWMGDAVAAVADLNARGRNVYVVRNPIRNTAAGSAKDEDIIASFFLWADCDDATSAGNIKRFDGPKYAASVVTGRVPESRVHIYWQLEEPCTDMNKWRDMQTRIAAHFKSDRAVINPSRIMRIGGTITWPDSKKQARGYVSEKTTLRTQYDDARPPVTLDQMGRVFGASNDHLTSSPSSSNDWIDGDQDRKTVGQYADALRRARTDGEKHTGVRDLSASLAGAGVPEALAEAIIRGACPVWDGNVEDLIRSAYSKFYRKPEDIPKPVTQEAISDFRIDSSHDFLADLEPLEYLIDGLLPRGVTYSLTGYAGHGKTTLALQFALSVATGDDFSGRAVSKGDVLILAGENPYNVKWQYAAALAARELNARDVPIHFVQGRFSIKQFGDVLRAKMNEMPNLKLVIIDSLQAFFEGDNDNDNTQMVEMAHKVRHIVDTDTRPALLVIAHPAGKIPSKENLVPRGGGAFLNEIDGNLTVWSGDSSQQTLHHSQKFRGAGFDQVEFVMQIHEFPHLTDINGIPLKLPVSRPEVGAERAEREQRSEDLLRRFLGALERGQSLSVRDMASQFGITRYRAETIITTARDEKLIRRYAKKWAITDGGREFLND